MRLRVVLFTLIFSLSAFYTVSGEEKRTLTFEQAVLNYGSIYFDSLPDIPGWADDTHYYRFDDFKLLKVNARNGKSRVFLDYSKNSALKEHGFTPDSAADHSAGYRRFLFKENNSLYLYTVKSNKLVSLSLVKAASGKKPGAKITNPKLSPDGGKIAYTLNNDLYIYNIAKEKNHRITRDASENILNGYASWVYYEEILGRGSRYRAFWWSPDSRKLVFMRFDQTKVPVFPLYNSTGTYGYLEKARYPKPGYPNPTVKLGVADLDSPGKTVTWIPFTDSGDHYLAFPVWNRHSSKIYFQWMNRGQDHQKILLYDLKKNNIETVYEEKQDAWVDFFEDGDFHLLANGDFILRSSRDGWYHLYYISLSGGTRQLTSGDWSATGIERVNEKKKTVFFSAYKEDSTQLDLYRASYRGKSGKPGALKRLTSLKGFHSVDVSPSGRYFLDRFSDIESPARLELRSGNGKLLRVLGDSSTPGFKKLELGKVKLSRIATKDGYALPVIWYLPPGFDPGAGKKYPVVMTIYGGPGSALVRNRFYGGYRRGLSTFYYAQNGIINLYVDHRGAGHFGKKGMALMHRNLGKWEMHDYIEVVKYLQSQPYIDGNKIGIIGHSYGGYLAALALTYGSEYFKYGISGSPVIDWRLYDSVYTERYMDTPDENPEGYKQSSTLTHIQKFKGKLRMTHGTMDDNVHPQNAIQFIDKLLDTGNTAEFMLYPGARHGVRGKKRKEYNKSIFNFWLKHFFNKTID